MTFALSALKKVENVLGLFIERVHMFGLVSFMSGRAFGVGAVERFRNIQLIDCSSCLIKDQAESADVAISVHSWLWPLFSYDLTSSRPGRRGRYVKASWASL